MAEPLLPVQASGMGLAGLSSEPHRLESEAGRCNAELEALVMENYRIFVENLTCSVHLRQEDKKLGEVAGELRDKLQGLSQQCTAFKDRVNHFVNSHKRNRKTLQHHMQLVELLEVPQLVDACARNGFHEEALELANFVNGLERRHLLAAEVRPLGSNSSSSSNSNSNSNSSNSNSNNSDGTNGKDQQQLQQPKQQQQRGGSDVIQSIVDDVHATLLGLRQQLIALLSQQASLPKELQVLATLRKLDGLLIDRQLALERYDNAALIGMSEKQREKLRQHFLQSSETRLQMEFLEARTIWLERLAERVLHGGLSVSALTALEGGGGGGGVGADAPGSLTAAAAAATGGGDAPSSEAAGGVKGDGKFLLGSSSLLRSNALGPYGKAIEMLEASRTSWFSIITQFNALFEDSIESGSAHPTTTILSAWAARRVHQLLIDLEALLVNIEEGAAFRSVLEQALFFASRMGQVGCDFSGSLVPVFKNIIVSRVGGDWKTSAAHFKTMLATERFTIEVESVIREQIVPLYLSQEQAAGEDQGNTGFSPSAVGKKAFDDIPAPSSIMTYPPLAYLLNSLLTGMNFLRECPIMSAQDDVLAELRAVVVGIVEEFVAIAGDVRTRGARYFPSSSSSSGGGQGAASKRGKATSEMASSSSENNNEMDRHYARAIACEMLPHVLLCFEHIFYASSSSAASSAADFSSSSSSSSSSSTAVSKRGKDVALRVDKLSDASEHLSDGSFAILQTCWSTLTAANLLKEASAKTASLSSSAAAPPASSSSSSSTAPNAALAVDEE